MNANFCKKIFYSLLLITNLSTLEARTHKYRLDVTNNEFGLNKYTVICTYDDIAKNVECVPVDPNAPDAFHSKYFSNVYVRKLTSDPVGIGYIGKYRNRSINPGFIEQYTSTRENFSVYTSKY